MLDFVLPLILGVFLAQASPGPNLMAVASVSLGAGRRAGLSVAAGVASGVFVWAILFSFGFAALFDAFPAMVTAMKLVGGGYLLYLALMSARSAIRGYGQVAKDGNASDRKGRFFLLGFLVVLTNPKAALMWIAVSVFLAAAELSETQFLVVGLSVSISALLIYSAYALVFSTGRVTSIFQRFSRIINGLFGAVFGIVGGRLVWDGLKELKP